jgi:predicted nucleic acid-binding protein
LDNCCFNRPFDDQGIVRNRLETEAKMYVQSQILNGGYELVWSYILEYENSENPYADRKSSIIKWKEIATSLCSQSEDIVARAKDYEAVGFKPKDALHIACAIEMKADYLLTTDKGILTKSDEELEIINPIDFVRKEVQQ